MWNSISGELTRKGLESIFVQSGDLEWEIAMGRFSIDALAPVGQRVKIYTWLQHTEDSMKLFGFSSVQERSLFLDLIKVSGVGPKLALKCLSGLRHNDFAAALELGDAPRLAKVPGLGLKTAQKIILALKGKLLLDDETSGEAHPLSELIAALAEMGFDRKAAEKVVTELSNEPEVLAVSGAERERVLFQKALVRLSAAG